MPQQYQFIPPVITAEVEGLFSQLGQYDDPYLLLLFSQASEDIRASVISDALDTINTPVIHLNDNVSFSLIFCDTNTSQIIADDLIQRQGVEAQVGYLSLFRHNCLGQVAQTFDWAVQQLNELIEQGANSSQVAINDFSDKLNWPGIDKYRNNKPLEYTNQRVLPRSSAEVKPSLFRRLFKLLPEKLSKNKRQGNLGSEFKPGEALMQLKPFIQTLPNGEFLWRYVLTGENKQELDERDAFINLDSVLLLLHAKQYSPEFYQEVLDSVPYSSVPSQEQVHDSMHRVFHCLMYELLEAETEQDAKQACFLRIMDVFYGIFDQTPWPDKIHQILVEDEMTACMDERAFQLRFSEEEQGSESLSALTQQSILELLDDLESYHFASNAELRKIDKIFANSRAAVDPDEWRATEPRSRLLLASILLHRDKTRGIEDDKTKKLQQLVSELLTKQVIQIFTAELKADRVLPDVFVNWLQSTSSQEASIQAVLIKPLLAGGIGLDDHRTEGTAQPHYQLYSNVSDFQPVLACCYWLQQSGKNQVADKVVQLSLALAPQASLQCFARLYLARFGGFAEQRLEKEFVKTLMLLDVDEYDLLCFEIRIAQAHDFAKYTKLLRRYNRYSQKRVELWDRALTKLKTKHSEAFYLDAHRLSSKVTTPLLAKRQAMLQELIRTTAHLDDDFFANQFVKEEVLFSDHCEFLPQDYHLSVQNHQSVIPNKVGRHFIVLRHVGTYLELLVDNPVHRFNEEQNEWPMSSHYVIVHQDVEVESVFDRIEKLQSYEQRAEQLLSQMQLYLAGDVAFADYQKNNAKYSDLKAYDLDIEHYSKHSPSILPQILIETDEQVQLRLIRLLASHQTRGKRVLTRIAEEMFFHDCISKGHLDLADYKEGIEVADLTEEWVEHWQSFSETLKQKVMAVE